MAHDHLVRAIMRDLDVRIAAVVTTATVAEAARRHQLSPAAACAVGRGISAGVLLATLTKGAERVTVQLQGDGPLHAINVDATAAGEVRAYAQNPQAGLDLDATGRFRTATILGQDGVVNVLRDLGMRELYQGQVRLTTGEVDEDVETYLRISEQVPSALGCEVVIGVNSQVVAAGGILVQTLPGGDPDIVREVQHTLRTGGLFELLASGEGSARVLAESIWGPAIEFVGEERPIRFQCRCSPDRIGDMLQLLTIVDLDEMIAEDKPAEITCNFCNERYEIDRPTLERIRAQIAGRPRENN